MERITSSKPLRWFIGTLTTSYVLTQFVLSQIRDYTTQSKLLSLQQSNLEKRFNLNVQDIKLIILTLFTSIAPTLLLELDVEELSATLISRAAAVVPSLVPSLPPAPATVIPSPPLSLSTTLLNPDANVFIPSSPSWPAALMVTRPISPVIQNEPVAADAIPEETTGAVQQDTVVPNLSKSWAQIVVNDKGIVEEAAAAPITTETNIPALFVDTGVEEEDNLPKPPTKAEIWNEIKILSFTRTITTLYLLVLLSLQSHIQLNLIGRSSYLSSLVASTTGQTDFERDFNFERDLEAGTSDGRRKRRAGVMTEGESRIYLSFSWYLLHVGWKALAERVREAVEIEVGSISLKALVSAESLSTLLMKIRTRVEFTVDGEDFDFSSILYPAAHSPAELEILHQSGSTNHQITPELRLILNETNEFLHCSDAIRLRKDGMTKMMVELESSLAPLFSLSPAAPAPTPSSSLFLPPLTDSIASLTRFEEVTDDLVVAVEPKKEIKLAAMLPSLTKIGREILTSEGTNSNYLEALEELSTLTQFDAIVYTSWDKEAIC